MPWERPPQHQRAGKLRAACVALCGGRGCGTEYPWHNRPHDMHCLLDAAHDETCNRITKSAEKPRRSGRGWIGVGRAGLNAQAPNKTHAVPEPSMGEGTAEVEAPAFMPGRTSTLVGMASLPDDRADVLIAAVGAWVIVWVRDLCTLWRQTKRVNQRMAVEIIHAVYP